MRKDDDSKDGNDDKGRDDDRGQHRTEDNTDDARRNRPVPPDPSPGKHDR
ncbi:MAG: hypothetical protein ACRDRB_04025 [Pseudonocardiaceae bacterium]